MFKAFRRVSNPTLSISPGKQETQSGIIPTNLEFGIIALSRLRIYEHLGRKSRNHLLAKLPSCYYKYVYIILDMSCCLVWSAKIKHIFSLQLLLLPVFTVVTPPWSVLFDGECADLQLLMSWQLADALLMPCKCFSAYFLVQFICDHVCSGNTCTWGTMSRAFSTGRALIWGCSE
jgi:hypothetical protein